MSQYFDEIRKCLKCNGFPSLNDIIDHIEADAPHVAIDVLTYLKSKTEYPKELVLTEEFTRGLGLGIAFSAVVAQRLSPFGDGSGDGVDKPQPDHPVYRDGTEL
jgi:hypothetical protein